MWQEDGLTIGEIVSRSRKDFAYVTRIIEKLEKQEYVKKKKNKEDGRSYRVYGTEKSNEIKPGILKCQQRSSDISLNGISRADQQKLFQIIERMEKNSLSFLGTINPYP